MTEWLLAFDAGCGSCSDVIDRITDTVKDRLTVVGLGDERVRELRHHALGEHPPFAPTLLAVDTDDVRAWTGAAMSVRLLRLLGAGRSFEVVRALNQADVIVHGSRRSFLKAVPAVALGAFVFSGGLAAPAMAAPGRRMTLAEAHEWAGAQSSLPTGYRQVTALSMPQRRAVYARSSTQVKAELWLEHLRQYKVGHRLTAAESALLDKAAAAVQGIVATTTQVKSTELQDEAIAVLGHDRAVEVFATLGQPEAARSASAQIMTCDCHIGFSGCTTCRREDPVCQLYWTGCGFMWNDECNGVCGG